MYSAEDFARDSHVSRETLVFYHQWHALLVKWNQSINLVQRNSLDDFWWRHARDSHQVTDHIPASAKHCIDLGSGAGFPGLSLAIAMRDRPDARVTLVESAGKKASFLRTAIRELGLPAQSLSERAEALPAQIYDIVSARAFAPLPKLLNYAERFWGEDTIGLFLKGQSADIEIEAARETYTFEVDRVQSVTDPEGQCLIISHLRQAN